MEFGKHLGKGIWGLADKLLPVVYGLAYVWLVIRVLPKEEFGNFVLVQEIFLVITGLATALALQPLLKFVAEGEVDLRDHNSAAVMLSFLFLVLCSVVIVLFRIPMSAFLNSMSLAPLLLYLPAMFGAAFFRNLSLNLLQSRFMIKEVFWTDAFHFLGTPLLIWIYSRMHRFDTALDLVVINILSLSASSLAGLYLARSLMKLRLVPGVNEVRKLWDYGKWSFGGTLSGFTVSKADTFLLAAFSGTMQVAEYGSVKVFVRVYEMLTQVIQMFVLPAASRLSSNRDFKSLKAMVEKATMFSTLSVVPVFVAFLVFPTVLITVLYKGKYVEAIPILQVFALAALAVPPSAVAGNVLMGLGHARTVFLIGLQIVLVALASYLIFIPRFAGTGAAMGYVITSYASALLALWYVRKHIPLTIGEILKRTNDVVVFVRTRLGF
jgi:O-antigen/teichoic acid export membrane protein